MKYFKSLNGKHWYKVPDEEAKNFKKPLFIEVTKSEFLAINPEPTKAELDAIAHNRSIKKQIVQLKSELARTDYQAIKHSEGWISDEDYAPIKAQRQSIRDRINELETELA